MSKSYQPTAYMPLEYVFRVTSVLLYKRVCLIRHLESCKCPNEHLKTPYAPSALLPRSTLQYRHRTANEDGNEVRLSLITYA